MVINDSNKKGKYKRQRIAKFPIKNSKKMKKIPK